MKTIIQWIFCLTLFTSVITAQVIRPFVKQTAVPENLKHSLENVIDRYQLVSVDYKIVNNLITSRPVRVQMEIPVTAESIVSLDLERYDILDPAVQIVKGTDHGDISQNFNRRFVSYKIRWDGADRPLTVLNFSDYHINGVIELNGEIYELGALKGFENASVKDHIIYPVNRLKMNHDFTCHTDENHPDVGIMDKIEKLKSGKTFDVLSSNLLVCNLAVEMDYQAYQYYGSAESATAYVLSLFSTSSAVYNRDINTLFKVTYVRVWTTSSDPYTDSPSGSSVLLNEFRNYWNINMRHVPRTIAHYASPRNQGLGGIAYVGVLCASITSGSGYGFSDYQGGNSVTPLPTYTWQTMVVTHEIGHNFGSPHTHSCYWNPPIDTCYFGSETQGCVTGTGCTLNNVCIPRQGTIMSYCHLTSAGTRMYFGPQPSALMRSYAQAASCMLASSNSIRVGQPNGHESYSTRTSASAADPTTVITWGSTLTDPVDILFSPDSGLAWQSVATNIPFGTREYVWSIPYVQTTDNALIRVIKSGDPSVGDTSDSPFTINLRLWSITNQSPANNTTILVDSNDMTPYTFVWTRAGNVPGIFYKYHLRKRTGTAPTAIFLTGNSGSDTAFTITARSLDSCVTSWNLWSGDSIQCFWYGVGYNLSDTVRVGARFNLTIKRPPGVNVIDNLSDLPAELALYPCYPNPFNPSTTITYDLPENTPVTLRIYNMLGQEIRQLVKSNQVKGRYSIQWDGTNHYGNRVSSGIYFYSLETKLGQRIRKMTFIK